MKIASFGQYLTVQIVLTERKTSIIAIFPQLLKKNGKEDLKLLQVRREKWLNQIFRKDLTERKLKNERIIMKIIWNNKNERIRMKIMLSASPSSVFSHKVHSIRFEKQTCILSLIMVNELGLPVSKSLTRISKFYDPTDLEPKFHKTRIKNWLPQVSKWDFTDWEPTIITTTPCSTYSMMGSL